MLKLSDFVFNIHRNFITLQKYYNQSVLQTTKQKYAQVVWANNQICTTNYTLRICQAMSDMKK